MEEFALQLAVLREELSAVRQVNTRFRGLLAGRDVELAAARARIERQAATITAQATEIKELSETVAALRDRLGIDSNNSGTPPSAEKVWSAGSARGRRRSPLARVRCSGQASPGWPARPRREADGDDLQPGSDRDGARPAAVRWLRRKDAGDPGLARLPEAVARLIEFDLAVIDDRGKRRTSRLRLLTTLLDPTAHPAIAIAQVYAERWQIELAYFRIKVTLRGSGKVLRGQTPALARQEI
jgi:hypothetical protein